MSHEDSKVAYRISIQSIFINFLLCAFKGVCGFLIGSASLLSDAVHSLTDIISTFIVMIGIKMSSKPPDEGHPYGHEKIECIIAFLLGIMLFVIGGGIGWSGIQKLVHPPLLSDISLTLNSVAILAAVTSIIGKEWMYRFTIRCARQINSSSMAADAWHHRSDALSSVGSFIGVIGIRLGVPVVDAIACLIISVFVFKAAYGICADACKNLVDSACSKATIDMIAQIVSKHPQIQSIDVLKARQYGSKVYIDLEITLDMSLSFVQSHHIAQAVHDEIEESLSFVKHCMIHTNPSCLTDHHHI